MKKLNRRSFLRLSGAGMLSAVATIAAAGEASAAPASRSTPVIRIEALANVNIRVGASIRSRKCGMLYAGYQATVLAISYDPYAAEAVAVLARTDPNEQESVVLRPDLEDRHP